MGRRHAVASGALVFLFAVAGQSHVRAATGAPVFGTAVKLGGAADRTEPRVTIAPGDVGYVVTNDVTTKDAIVYGSSDHGATWSRTAAEPAGQSSASIDVDVVSTHTGRLIATELDYAGVNFRTSYSDDGGRTWTPTGGPLPIFTGTGYVDNDRPWLSVGPDDATTHQPRVYLLFHNLASGAVSHNMFVATSTDNGTSFGAPVPITVPGDQAFTDLQCADSGGPSNIIVNQVTGQVYAVFGTRSSPVAGGCGASVTGSPEINVVAATRVWVATSKDGSLGSWTQSLAVDDNATGKIVGMQLAPATLDAAGNVYVFYPESTNQYPDYDGAALKYVHAGAGVTATTTWSTPVTVAGSGGAGHLLPHVVAGDPGKLDFAYYTGVARPGTTPLWYTTVAQTLDGLSASPHFSEVRLSDVSTYTGTASLLMGACGTGPQASIQNGTVCPRSTDVWGVALDSSCDLTVAWPSAGKTFNDDPSRNGGTWVSTQVGGPAVCSPAPRASGTAPVAASGNAPTSSSPPQGGVQGLPNTDPGGAAGTGVIAFAGLVLGLLAQTGRRRRR